MTTPANPVRQVTLTANQLRALAEEADGRRGKNLVFVAADDAKRPAKLVAANDDGQPDEDADSGQASEAVTIVIRTDDVRKKNPGLQVVLPGLQFNLDGQTIEPKKSPATNEYDDYSEAFDALFWSAAAVDKFVVRYYSSFMDLDAIQKQIKCEFDTNPDLLAIGHLPDSEPADGSPTQPIPGLVTLTLKVVEGKQWIFVNRLF